MIVVFVKLRRGVAGLLDVKLADEIQIGGLGVPGETGSVGEEDLHQAEYVLGGDTSGYLASFADRGAQRARKARFGIEVVHASVRNQQVVDCAINLSDADILR